MCKALFDDQCDKQVQKAISASCRILAIREHSAKQIRLKLIKKGFSSDAINKAIEWASQENWLSEERFCSSFIRSKAAKGQGRLRIEAELQQQSIDELVIAKCFSEEAIDWLLSCKNVASKKLASLIPQHHFEQQTEDGDGFNWQLSNSIKMKLERFLRYRGFTNDEIIITIRQCFSNQESI